jgi:hypothetical protein
VEQSSDIASRFEANMIEEQHALSHKRLVSPTRRGSARQELSAKHWTLFSENLKRRGTNNICFVKLLLRDRKTKDAPPLSKKQDVLRHSVSSLTCCAQKAATAFGRWDANLWICARTTRTCARESGEAEKGVVSACGGVPYAAQGV